MKLNLSIGTVILSTIVAAAGLFSSTAQAAPHDSAECQSGYTINVGSNTHNATCTKNVKVWEFVSNRGCPPFSALRNAEANDGGDLCTANGGIATFPANICGIGERMVTRRNAHDRCEKQIDAVEFGHITIIQRQ